MVDNKSKDDITAPKRDADKLTARPGSEDDKTFQVRTTLSEQHESVDRVLDETKDNINRTLEEARRDIPRNTQAINDYHEHSLEATKEITDSYLESQKEIVKVFQSNWFPYLETTYGALWNNWTSPRVAEIYARTVGNFADNIMITTRIANNAILANIKAFLTFVQHERDDVNEFSRMGVNAARTFAQTSKDVARERDININRY